MEKRLIAAIVLSFIVLVGYQLLFVKPQPMPDLAPQGTEAAEPAERPAGLPPAASEAEAARPAPAGPRTAPSEAALAEAVPAVEGQAYQEITVDTSLYRAVWSNRGGVLRSWKLKKHKNDNKEDLELVSSKAEEFGRFPFSIWTEDADFNAQADQFLFQASQTAVSLGDGQKGELRFDYSDGQGVKIEKIYVFKGGVYDFDIQVNVWKNGQKADAAVLWGPGIGRFSPGEEKQRFAAGSGMAVSASGRVSRIDQRKYKPELSAFNFVNWAAYEENYFAALFITPSQKGTAVFLREEKDAVPYYFVAVSRPEKAFVGPKEFDALRAFGYDSKKIINFGFFGSIAEVLLIMMKYFHKYVSNWGLAIIILTFVIKILFFPLTYSSTKSMAKMQELQPKIKALRAKYKKAKQDIDQRRQMNEEMMKLYKEQGVNPAGGCLPMLIQIPVFWGVFRMLAVAVEFRQSPFVFWIKDLSVKDPTYVTPIMMGVTQFISQKMTPTSADPSQAKMMLIMPVVMTVFFMNFQSGLILYWLTTNVLQIAQQAIMNKMMAKKKRESDGKRRKK